jgi:hypothetical protein
MCTTRLKKEKIIASNNTIILWLKIYLFFIQGLTLEIIEKKVGLTLF